MEKRFLLRIYPTKEQEKLIQRTFGCARFIYNYFLDYRIKKYNEENISLTANDCSKILTELKKEKEFLQIPDKYALQNVLKDLDMAYKRFQKGLANYPKFKSRSNYKTYRTNRSGNKIRFVSDNIIILPKLREVKFKNNIVPDGEIVNVAIIQKPSGKYYASVLCRNCKVKNVQKTGKSVGIDLGIKDYIVTSDGQKIPNNHFLKKTISKIKRMQKEFDRKKDGSNNKEKLRIKIAKQYEKLTNARKDYIHKLSMQLIEEYDDICIEDLKIKDMVKNKQLSFDIMDCSWYELRRQLEYKAKFYDKKIHIVDRYFPSSKKCSVCDYKKEDLSLNDRFWTCPNCGTVHDRDINAAKNILKEGMKN